jgi:hypothetical protein
MSDVHYGLEHLNKDQKIQLMRDAHAICTEWWADVLDCKKSFHRIKVEISLDEILSKADDATMFTAIYRDCHCKGDHRHVEISLRTMTNPDYFLWIIVDIVSAYGLLLNYGIRDGHSI